MANTDNEEIAELTAKFVCNLMKLNVVNDNFHRGTLPTDFPSVMTPPPGNLENRHAITQKLIGSFSESQSLTVVPFFVCLFALLLVFSFFLRLRA